MAIAFNIKYATGASFDASLARQGDVIVVRDGDSKGVYLGITEGNPIKIADNYDEFAKAFAELQPMIGTSAEDGKLVWDSSTAYIGNVSSIAQALVMLDQAIKENGDNDEVTESIDASTIDNLFG